MFFGDLEYKMNYRRFNVTTINRKFFPLDLLQQCLLRNFLRNFKCFR